MQITSQKMIPTQLNVSPGLAPKSPGVQPNSRLTISAPDGEPIITGNSPHRPKKIAIEHKTHGNEVRAIIESKSRTYAHQISTELVYISRALDGGSPSSPKSVLRDDGTSLCDGAWDKFLTGVYNSGEYQDEYILLTSKLAGIFGTGEKQLNAFTDFASSLSSEDLQTFMKTYRTSPVPLTGEAGQAFTDFAGDLAGDDLKNFMIAVHNAPDDLKSIVSTGSKLAKDDLGNFLAAASKSGDKVALLAGRVDQILNDKEQPKGSADPSTFLAAAAKVGALVIDLVESTVGVSAATTDQITNFINSEIDNRHELKQFVALIGQESEESINTLIDLSSPLAERDKANLLDAASGAGNDLGELLRSLAKYAAPGAGHSSAELSNYLGTAAKAEGKLGLLITLSDRLDLSFTGKLSAVDTVNFLAAAEDAGSGLDQLTKLGSQLSGSDRSNFFYAAAQAGSDGLPKFMDEVASLNSAKEQAEFLGNSAQQGEADGTPAVYLKGLLSSAEYADFQKSAAMLPDQQLDSLVGLATELQGPLRADLLEIAAKSEERVGELTTLLTHLSRDEQVEFIELAKGLGEQDLKGLVKASGKTDENFSSFIALAKELKQEDGAELGYFLSAAEEASRADLNELIGMTNKLGEEQQKLTNREGVEMRHSFLNVASDAGRNLKGVIAMAKAMIPMGPGNFAKAFESAQKATAKNLGMFLDSYV